MNRNEIKSIIKEVLNEKKYLLPKDSPVDNDIILVPGIGTMKLSQLKKNFDDKNNNLKKNFNLNDNQLNVFIILYKTLRAYKNKTELKDI